jgi:hypothetical protein
MLFSFNYGHIMLLPAKETFLGIFYIVRLKFGRGTQNKILASTLHGRF